jgi:hypothetical protein
MKLSLFLAKHYAMKRHGGCGGDTRVNTTKPFMVWVCMSSTGEVTGGLVGLRQPDGCVAAGKIVGIPCCTSLSPARWVVLFSGARRSQREDLVESHLSLHSAVNRWSPVTAYGCLIPSLIVCVFSFIFKLSYDRPSIGQPVLASGHCLRPVTDFLSFPWKIISSIFGFLLVGRPSWREDGSVIYPYNCYWALPALWRLSQSPTALETIFYCLIWDCSLSVASYDKQGYGGSI